MAKSQTEIPGKSIEEMLAKANAEGKSVAIRTDMDANEWKAMADSKLQELLQTSSGSLLLAAVRESKDRLEGKPAQAIHLDATVRQVTVNATIRFADQPLVIENETAIPISGNGMERIE